MNTSRANGGNNYTWRGANEQRRCDHNSRVVCCLVLGQLNDLVISSTSHLCPPVNYQSRCSSRNVVACSVRNRIVTMETEPPLLPFLFFSSSFFFFAIIDQNFANQSWTNDMDCIAWKSHDILYFQCSVIVMEYLIKFKILNNKVTRVFQNISITQWC